ncbi:MAG TPA: peptidylprolyl isomerase [Burkholderiaceae bacterium]|nr:peptidylprolyl isomerase [Burkholderiaceae bacterium]
MRRGAAGRVRRRIVLAALCAAMSATAGAQPRPRVRVRVETALGPFTVEVDAGVAPRTVANFLAYVDGGHLDGGAVYRLVTLANQPPETRHPIEVVQWGFHASDSRPPPFAPIPHETTRDSGLRHRDGTLSMARAAPGTASGEFFICIGDQPSLDFGGGRNPDGQGFAAFGQVVEGMDVVRALHARAGAEQFLREPIPLRRARRLP